MASLTGATMKHHKICGYPTDRQNPKGLSVIHKRKNVFISEPSLRMGWIKRVMTASRAHYCRQILWSLAGTSFFHEDQTGTPNFVLSFQILFENYDWGMPCLLDCFFDQFFLPLDCFNLWQLHPWISLIPSIQRNFARMSWQGERTSRFSINMTWC